MKNKFVWNRPRISSVITFFLALGILWQGTHIKALFTTAGGSDVGSAFFPNVVAIIMLLCSIGKFITSNEPDKEPFLSGRGWLRVLITLTVLALYVLGLKYLGFLCSTFVTCTVLVAVMKMGNPIKWMKLLMFSAVVTAVLYVLFSFVLQVWLPVGRLWELL